MSDLNNMTAAESAATKAAIMNQVPGSEIEGQSPLHHADFASLAQQGPKTGGIHLREHKLLGHLTLRCNAENAEQLAAVERVLGVALPLQPLSSVESGNYSIRWMSPDEWLILVPGLETFEIETKFRDAMPGHYSLVNSSGGSTVLELSGDNAVTLLQKATSVDLHLNSFPVGKVVSTLFAKSTATIRRIDEQRFELVIRRSFSDYIWLWIQDASLEYGLVIEA
ncbi:sarcosine oxidase subunit gamma family protein [Amphritea sp. 1_MG-2023]|uniref:sarcosine oxidase subunit gamma n=1 Tax=Amphritea sp. 1_MG-2023 TaxID=3062670 RepID=UPI0026E1E681|nr:sarcosine oxidase subunit gamma family protein [Amphritea sp. 1_MG-2023]MDO6561920.1 sarcosine oxidase subunit gamma family protein [Amphritea sp. 1_MG-2023]